MEIYFSHIITKNLKVDELLEKYISKKHDSLSKKRELIRALKIELPFTPTEYQEKIEFVRNKVIHAGYLSNNLEARMAFRLTSDTFNQGDN